MSSRQSHIIKIDTHVNERISNKSLTNTQIQVNRKITLLYRLHRFPRFLLYQYLNYQSQRLFYQSQQSQQSQRLFFSVTIYKYV
jgi:hypothetical protein